MNLDLTDCLQDDCSQTEESADKVIFCDGYPISEFERLVAEAVKKTNTISEYYEKIVNGINPKIFCLINRLQNDLDQAQCAILFIQNELGMGKKKGNCGCPEPPKPDNRKRCPG